MYIGDMFSKLLAYPVNNRYCKICFLTVGLTYIVFKTTNIHTHLRYILNKWRQKNNVTYVVSSVADTGFVVNQLRRRLCEKQFLGLDCEWVSVKNKRRPVALLQLAAPDGYCSLFRLSSLKTIPKDLVDLLEDKKILKVGVAVVADARYLLSDYGVYCEGCLDLRHLADQVGVEPRGLANLAKDLFGVELNKDWRVRCSDWEAEILSPIQKQYAAQDACIAVDIFDELNHREICRKYSTWKRVFWSKKDYWTHSSNLWSSYIGLNFKKSSRSSDDSSKRSKHSELLRSRRSKPDTVVLKKNYHTLLQKQHYSNIFLLAPDGQVLCTISESKASWYLGKELAEVVSEEPKTLKLTFEPSRRTADPDGYYTKPKDNICVVCGSGTDLRRKNVVPIEYRRHFEDELKMHTSHDVLLLCLVCHTKSNIDDQSLRDRLVVECDAPLTSGNNSKFCDMPDMRSLRSAARALFYSSEMIPADRRAHLEARICEILAISSDQLTFELLENIINVECIVESDKYVPHGLKVVQHYCNHEGVESLERRWRQHFMDTMRPRYLPDLWTVNYVRDSTKEYFCPNINSN